MNRLQKITSYFNKERLTILGLVVVLYFNTLRNGYALDDSIVTEPNNLTTQGIKVIPKLFKSFYIGSSEDYQFEYRPMVKVSFAIEHQFFGVSAKTSHFFNILFYIIGLYLFYSVLKLLFKNYNALIPFYIVIVFAVLPIHTEVVSSIKNRDILLCFIFSMLSLRNYYFFYDSGFKKWQHLAMSIVFLFIGFLCKFDALPFFAIIPVIFYAKDPSRIKWVAISIVFLLSAFLLYRITRNSLVDTKSGHRLYYYFENPLYFTKGFVVRVIAALNTFGFYLAQCIYPIKQCCYYGYDTVPLLKLGSYGYLGIVAAPLMGFGLFKAFKKREFVIFTGLFIFIASISMYLNFAKPAVGIVADRYTFFASMGFSVALVGVIFKFFKLKNDLTKKIKIISVIVISSFAITIINRNNDWKSMSTVLAADISKYPNNAFLNYKTGIDIVKNTEERKSQLTMEQRKQVLLEAKKYLEKSIEIEPNYPNARNYISYVLVYLLNDFNAALPHINSSLSSKPTTEIVFYKAIVMRETNHKDSAEFYLKKCVKMDSTFYNAYSLLMYDYNINKEYQKSIQMFNVAITQNVKTEQIYMGLAKTYEEMKDNEKAILNYKEILRINPQNTDVQSYLNKLENKR